MDRRKQPVAACPLVVTKDEGLQSACIPPRVGDHSVGCGSQRKQPTIPHLHAEVDILSTTDFGKPVVERGTGTPAEHEVSRHAPGYVAVQILRDVPEEARLRP